MAVTRAKAKQGRTQAPNPLRIDPTRTTGLRNKFAREIKRRFARVKGRVTQLILTEDIFGLKKPDNPLLNVFCPTGPGGGVDPHCSPTGSISVDTPEGTRLTQGQVVDHILKTNPPEQIKQGKMTKEEWAEKFLSNEPDGYIVASVHPKSLYAPTELGEPGKVDVFSQLPQKTTPLVVIDSNDKLQARFGGGKLDQAYGLLPHTIIDGKHRVASSIQRGDSEIKAIVPARKLSEIKRASENLELIDFAHEYAKQKGGTEIKVMGSHEAPPSLSYKTKEGLVREVQTRDLVRIAGKLGRSLRFTTNTIFSPLLNFNPNQPRDQIGRFSSIGGASKLLGKGSGKSLGEKASSILYFAANAPAAAMSKIKTKVREKYDKLESRYGSKYAKAIIGAALVGVPLPIPGSSFLTAAPVLAIAELHRRYGSRKPAIATNQEWLTVNLSQEEIEEAAQTLLEELTRELGEELKDIDSPSLIGNAQDWRFNTTPEQVKLFQDWLREQIETEILGSEEDEIWRRYAEDGMRRGAGRAFDDTRRRWDPGQGDFYRGSREQFLRDTFRQPVGIERIKLLVGRTFTDLKSVTEQMAAGMTRILADGLVQGKSPYDIAKELNAALDIGSNRAEVIARTEIIRAHAEGQLTAFEQMGVEEIGVAVEWSTAGDLRVCKLCVPLNGIVLKVSESHGLIPRHPRCRCSFIPANVGEDEEDQIRRKGAIEKAVRKSIELEGGKRRSDWPGTRLQLDRDRPESILNSLFGPQLEYTPEIVEFSRWVASQGLTENTDLTLGSPSQSERNISPLHLSRILVNVFCATGSGGGVDPHCSPDRVAGSVSTPLGSYSQGSGEGRLYITRKGAGESDPHEQRVSTAERYGITQRTYGEPHRFGQEALQAAEARAPELAKVGQLARDIVRSTVDKKTDVALSWDTKQNRLVVWEGKAMTLSIGKDKKGIYVGDRRIKEGSSQERIALAVYKEYGYGIPKALKDSLLPKPTGNVFCATGQGGGVDPHCSPEGSSKSKTTYYARESFKLGKARYKVGDEVPEHHAQVALDWGKVEARKAPKSVSSTPSATGVKTRGIEPEPQSERAVPHLTDVFTKLDRSKGGYNFVHLGDMRESTPGWTKEEFDSVLQKARRERIITLSPAEGRAGTSERDRTSAVYERDPVSGRMDQLLLYASLRRG